MAGQRSGSGSSRNGRPRRVGLPEMARAAEYDAVGYAVPQDVVQLLLHVAVEGEMVMLGGSG